MDCPYCGGKNVRYLGMDDGGGDYGDSIVDYWRCMDCDEDFEGSPYTILDPFLEQNSDIIDIEHGGGTPDDVGSIPF